jgi:nucleolar protein 56
LKVEKKELEAYVIETPVGVFVSDDKGKLIGKHLFATDPQRAATELKDFQEGKLNPSLLDTIKQTSATYSPFIFESQSPSRAVEREAKVSVAVRESKVAGDLRNLLSSESPNRTNWLKDAAIDSPNLKTARAYNEFARLVALQVARSGIASAASKRDLSAVQAVRAMDDLDKTLNLLAGRVREWYGLHFPEMDRLVERHDSYAHLVAKLGNRRNFTPEALAVEGLPGDKCQELAKAAARSMGAELEELDFSVLQSFCNQMLDLYKFREKSEAYVGEVMKDVAPNMTAVVGAALSARLISIAGSLQNLAKMPASTLQVLGAEKALFRSLKTGARPPKHGVIFQHTAIHQAPRWQRGKIARALSGKLTIASRVDAFSGEFVGEKLRDNVTKKIEEIKERYKTAPPQKKSPTPPPQAMKKREFARRR